MLNYIRREEQGLTIELQLSVLQIELSDLHSQYDKEQAAVEFDGQQLQQEQHLLMETIRKQDEEYKKYTEELLNKYTDAKVHADCLKEQLHEKTCR